MIGWKLSHWFLDFMTFSEKAETWEELILAARWKELEGLNKLNPFVSEGQFVKKKEII